MSQKFLSPVSLTGIANGSILKVNSSGEIVAAVDGTDYNTGSSQWTTTGNDIYYTTGKVGIGTNSPTHLLHLAEASSAPVIKLERTGTSDVMLIAEGSSYGYIQNTTGPLTLGGSGGAQQVYISTGGLVGIGTTTPASILHVKDDTSTVYNATAYQKDFIVERKNTSGNNQSAHIRFLVTGYEGQTTGEASIGVVQTSNVSSGHIVFTNRHNGTRAETLRIQSDGNVGIGETSPDGLLHIKGSAQATEFYIESSTGTASTSGAIKIAQNNRSAEDLAGEMAFYVQDTNVGGVFWREAMTIINSGNVGIGTTAPGNSRLKVSGATEISGNLYASGNVGIGTTSPSYKLHIAESNSSILSSVVDNTSNATGAYAAYRLQSDYGHTYLPGLFLNSSTNTSYAGVDQLMLYQFHSKPISLVTNNQVRLMVTGGGNVGIGVASPVQKLDVAGKMKITDDIILAQINGRIDYDNGNEGGALRFWSTSAASERMRITSAGNVGIGTTSPSQKLEVVGDIRIGQNSAIRFNTSGSSNDPGLAMLSDASFAFYNTASSTTLKITNGGNVGIGTTSPVVKLDVRGDVSLYAGGQYTDSFTASWRSVFIGSNATIFARDANNLTDFVLGNNHYVENQSSSPVNVARTDGKAAFVALVNDEFRFFYDSTSRVAGATRAFSESMRISGGNVGIGTTSPSSKLHVVGETLIDGTAYFDTNTGAQPFYITRSGASNQALKIHVDDSQAVFESIQDENGGESGYGSMKFILDAGDSGTMFQIFHGATERFTLDALGDLSIDGSLYVGGNVDGVDIAAFKTAYDSHTHSDATTSASGFMSSSDKTKLDNIASGADDYSGWNITDGTSSTKIEANNTLTLSAGTGMSISNEGGVVTFTSTASESDTLNTVTGRGATTTNAIETGNITISTSSPDLFFETGATHYNWMVAAQENVNAGFEISVGSQDADSSNDTWSPKLVILQSGNVGIGTTSPQKKLDVRGGYFMTNDGSGKESAFVQGGTGYAYFGNLNAGPAAFGNSEDWTTLVVDGGKVGIGTTSPSGKLHSYISETRQMGHNAVGGDLGVVSDNNSSPVLYVKGTGTADLVNVLDNTTNVFTIKDGGNVGIGTTNPGSKLEVQGTIAATGGIVSQSTSYPSSANIWGISNDYPATAYGIRYVEGSPDEIRIIGNSITNHRFGMDVGNAYLAINSGNVGIGTTNTYARLSVRATSHNNGISVNRQADTTAAIYIGNDGGNNPVLASNNADMLFGRDFNGTFTERMRLTNGGNVGIGTTSPATKLNIDIGSGGTNGIAGLRIGGTNNYPSLELGIYGAYGGMVRSYGNDIHYFAGHWQTIGNEASENHSHYWYTSKNGSSDWSTVKMELDHDGNLGIGTTSPIAKLDVAGATRMGGKTSYTKGYASLDTTGNIVAALTAGGNGSSAMFTFTMYGGSGQYQRVVYSCQNASGNWYTYKVIDEGTNNLDVVASDNGSTITFTFKATSTTQYYSPAVHVEHIGVNLNTSYL